MRDIQKKEEKTSYPTKSYEGLKALAESRKKKEDTAQPVIQSKQEEVEVDNPL